MTKHVARFPALLFAFALFIPNAFGQSVELANDYYQHGLNDKAKDILISTLHSASSLPANKAKSLYLLGQISFDEGRITVAIADWQTLAKTYPQTPEAKEINARLAQLNEIVTKISDTRVTSIVAGAYLSNGDFWSKAESKFVIDGSYLPEVELATAWYDRVIEEFPGSDAAERAYEKKMFALLGWVDPDGVQHGLKIQWENQKYFPPVLDTFASFESAFPEDSLLQAFRYQIAQAYWRDKDWTNTRLWLQKIIDKGKGQHTFYTEAAKARLLKVEH
jgi:tetratricopeptide (TPR) repeat protein